MTPEVLAVGAAFGYGLSDVCVKRGLRDTSATSGLLITLVAGAATILPVVIGGGIAPTTMWVLLVFGLAGMLGPGLGRIANIGAVRVLGPSLSAPIQASTYPLFGFLSGILVLGEGWTTFKLIGAVSIAVGVYVISQNVPLTRSALDVASEVTGLEPRLGRHRGLLLPLGAGLCYGLSDLVRKRGIQLGGDPGIGAATGLVTALIFWGFACSSVPFLRRGFRVGPSAGWFVLSGCSAAFASLFIFQAFQGGGNVSVVSPIAAASPIVVLFLSSVLLRDLEKVGGKVVLSALMVVLGTVVMSV